MNEVLALLPFLLAALAAALIIAMPLWRGRGRSRQPNDDAGLIPYRRRLRELDQDRAAKLLDADSYAEARIEAERELLSAGDKRASAGQRQTERPRRGIAILLFVLVPLLSFSFYAINGRPGLIVTGDAGVSAPMSRAAQLESIRENLPRLEKRVAERPRDVETWTMLVRGYLVVGQAEKALEATGRALDILGYAPALLVERARAIRMSEGRFTQDAVDALDRVLAKAPMYPDALWFRGLAAAQNGDWDRARTYWDRLRRALPEEARAQLDKALAQLPAGDEPVRGQKADAATIRVTVRLAERFATEIPPETTVFVYARERDGSGMPLAAARTTVAELPTTLRLDGSMAMAGGRAVQPDQPLEIVARVSLKGGVTASPGDMEGRVRVVPDELDGAAEVTVNSKL